MSKVVLRWIYYYKHLFFRMYQDKLAHLKSQLQQLRNGTHPEYRKKLKKIETSYKERYENGSLAIITYLHESLHTTKFLKSKEF